MQSIYTPKYQITIWIGYSGNLFKNLKMEKINLFLMVSVACNKWLRMHYPHTINCEVTSHCVCPYVCANYYFTRYMVNIKSRLNTLLVEADWFVAFASKFFYIYIFSCLPWCFSRTEDEYFRGYREHLFEMSYKNRAPVIWELDCRCYWHWYQIVAFDVIIYSVPDWSWLFEIKSK